MYTHTHIYIYIYIYIYVYVCVYGFTLDGIGLITEVEIKYEIMFLDIIKCITSTHP